MGKGIVGAETIRKGKGKRGENREWEEWGR